MEKVIRWGIVGPGNIARKFAKAVKKHFAVLHITVTLNV